MWLTIQPIQYGSSSKIPFGVNLGCISLLVFYQDRIGRLVNQAIDKMLFLPLNNQYLCSVETTIFYHPNSIIIYTGEFKVDLFFGYEGQSLTDSMALCFWVHIGILSPWKGVLSVKWILDKRENEYGSIMHHLGNNRGIFTWAFIRIGWFLILDTCTKCYWGFIFYSFGRPFLCYLIRIMWFVP